MVRIIVCLTVAVVCGTITALVSRFVWGLILPCPIPLVLSVLIYGGATVSALRTFIRLLSIR